MAPKKITKSKEIKKIEAPVFDIKGKETGKMILPSEIFNVQAAPELVSQAVRIYLANQRLGTKSTKTRSEVAGSTRKLFKQKGTGRARHGDKKAPIFIGGGIAHGPKQKDFSLSFPKKMRRKALFSVLTDALKSNKIKIVKGLEELPAKTQELAEVFDNLMLGKKKQITAKTLLVLSGNSENVFRAGRNIENLTIVFANQLHTYQTMTHKTIVFAQDAISLLEKTFVLGEGSNKKGKNGKTSELHATIKIEIKKDTEMTQKREMKKIQKKESKKTKTTKAKKEKTKSVKKKK